ncbi:MAG: hypothetical protein R2932_39190 [Caldilineaceae bacterium]
MPLPTRVARRGHLIAAYRRRGRLVYGCGRPDLSQLSSSVPEALGQISAQLTRYGWAQEIVDQLLLAQVMPLREHPFHLRYRDLFDRI